MMTVFGVIIAVSAGGAVATELPDESVLPGQKPISTIANLPDESLLPGKQPKTTSESSESEVPKTIDDVPITDNGQGDDKTDDQKDPPKNLPGEEKLPNRPAIPQIEDSPDERPWLRLRVGGPTAPIRSVVFTEDSKRLCLGGEDKSLWLWQRAADADNYLFERTVRWPVQRGQRGIITAIAPSGNLVAIAGSGAYGSNGDIFLFNANTGQLQNVLFDDQIGHTEVVTALSFSSNAKKPALVSADGLGKIMYWSIPNAERGLWQGKLLRPTDAEQHGTQTAEKLKPWRDFIPLVMTGESHVIASEFAYFDKKKYPIWKLVKINTRSKATSDLMPARTANYPWHGPTVTAMAIEKNGKFLASADAAGHRYLWTLRPQVSVRKFGGDTPVVSLSFSPNGKYLVAGSGASTTLKKPPRIELFDVARTAQPIASKDLTLEVTACSVRPDGRQLAYVQGDTVFLTKIDRQLTHQQKIRARYRAPGQVAFSAKPPYQIAFGTIQESGKTTPLKSVFDTRQVKFQIPKDLDTDDWITSDKHKNGWGIGSSDGGTTYWLYQNRQRRGQIPLDVRTQGIPATTCFIAAANEPQPYAVAIGLKGTNNILIFRIANQGKCRMLRQFRGHSAKVNSLALSHDRRYLASSSDDGSIRVWPTDGLQKAGETQNRWGANFTIAENRVVVSSIRADGPLYFRGMRKGDVISRLRYLANHKFVATKNAAETLAKLMQAPWNELLEFQYRRGAANPQSFQMFPAWQQVVTLFVDENGEWAYWSPTGYYDASFEGHKLFGWQVNRGRNESPDHFLAAQFRAALERPQVLSRLLEAGNIDGAFRLSNADVPARPDEAILDQFRLKPSIQILPPDPSTINDARISVRAEIQVPSGEQLAPPKAFANGVVAVDRKLIATSQGPNGTLHTYEWTAHLPSNRRILLQVIAATESEVTDTKQLILQRNQPARTKSQRMFLATVGVNRYQDSQIQRLDFAVNNATKVNDTFSKLARPLYGTPEMIPLHHDDANRQTWQIAMETFAEQMKNDASPDDLLVIFLSGHGLRDASTGEYHYVAHDARFEDIAGQRYGDCISFSDLSRFEHIPCRKLVILDTCHAGAINADQNRELKSALRTLQDDMIFTLTASQGNEEAVELRERKLGRFTYRLIEALQGKADSTSQVPDGITTLNEAIAYVKETVAQDSAADVYRQTPTAGPLELLQISDFPLTAPNPRRQRVSVSNLNLKSTRVLKSKFGVK